MMVKYPKFSGKDELTKDRRINIAAGEFPFVLFVYGMY
jgi:hypothetical protein